MKEYKRLKFIIISLLLFYFYAGLSTEIFLPGREKDFPPFFSWFLFSHVPSVATEKYAVLILEANGNIIEPILFDDAAGVVTEPYSPKARELISRFAMSIIYQRQEQETLRNQFEDIYLPPKTSYEVAVISYNPVERFKSKKFEVLKSLGKFNTN